MTTSTSHIRADLEGKLRGAEDESRAIVARAEMEHREPTDAEEKRFSELIGQANRWKRALETLSEYEAAQPEWTAVRTRLGLTDDSSGLPPGSPAGDAIRDMITSGERQHDFDLVPAFSRYREATRAIADFSDAASLYTSDFAGLFAAYLRTESPWFSVATVIRADNGRPMVVPGLSADPTVYTPGEGTAITESTPTLGNVTVTPVSYKWLGYASWESIEDAEYPLADRIAASAARAIALAAGSAFTADVLAGVANGGTATGLGGGGTATFVGYEDLLDLEYGRAAPYRASGAWVMSNGMIKKARKFVDKNGEYLWQPAAAQGQPDTFDGHPVYEDPYLAAPASATKSALFGDWGRALVIKATSLRFAQSPDARFANDQVALKCVLRADIAVVDSAAAAYLVSANT